MRYFVAQGETRQLDAAARAGQSGSFVELSDGITHYELAGPDNGPVVVFVPGLTIPLTFWDDVTRRLHQRGIRTLAYSAYGRGYSDRVRTRYDRDLFVRQLSELMARLDLVDIHLVASSMGALIALAHAGATDDIASLTLSGPAGLSAQRNPITLLPDRGPIAPLVGKYLLRRNLLGHLGHNVRTAEDVARLRALVLEGFRFEGSMYALLSTLKHFPLLGQDHLFDTAGLGLPPSMLIWGAQDQVTPATAYLRAVELLRPVRSELIDDCAHMASFERPAHFATSLATFVTERIS